MIRLAALLTALWGTGCAECTPLGEMPIFGSPSGDEGNAARAHLEWLHDAIAAPVCVSSVRIAPSSSFDGRYNSVTRQVRIATDLGAALERTLAHEVCHAVDVQNDVVRSAPGVFELLDELHQDRDYRGPFEREAFAMICAAGPHLEYFWGGQCDGPLDVATDRVRRDVYGWGDTPPLAAFEPIASVDLARVGAGDRAVHEAILRDIDPSGRAMLWVGGPDCCDPVDVDLWSGAVYPHRPRAINDSRTRSDAHPPQWLLQSGAVLPGRTEVVLAGSPYGFPAATQFRLSSRWGPDLWGPVLGHPCPNTTLDFFEFDGAVWSSQVADGRVAWGRWHEL